MDVNSNLPFPAPVPSIEAPPITSRNARVEVSRSQNKKDV